MLRKIEKQIEDFFNSRPVLRLLAATAVLPFFLPFYFVASVFHAFWYFGERIIFLGRTYIWMWATVVCPGAFAPETSGNKAK